MNELAWMNAHVLEGMTQEELDIAKARVRRYIPTCVCSERMTDTGNTKHTVCHECSRMYSRLPAGSEGLAVLAHNAVLETVQVIFNGNVTTKTFTWEM